MKDMIQELVQYRYLLFTFTWRDIKIKYKQAIMGFFWAIFMPIIIVAAGIVVRKAFSILSGNPLNLADISSVAVKSLPWVFFVGSIRLATGSLTGNTNLITKIYFPRQLCPVSAVLSNLFDFVIASTVLVIILAIVSIGISIHLLWLPLLLGLLILLTVSAALLLSCANLFFRDIKYIVEVFLTFGIFFTPVFYEANMFGKWESVLLLNPVACILEAINSVVVLHQAPDPFWLAYSAAWSVFSLLISWSIFHRAEFAFAENI